MNKIITLIALIALVAVAVAGRAYYRIYEAPMSQWLTYHAMTIEDDYGYGQSIEVQSFASFKKPVDISYRDVLRCKDSKGIFVNYSSQPFVIDGHYPPETETPLPQSDYGDGEPVYVSPWRYTQAVPKYDTTCHIRGTQEITLPFGIKKKSTIVTNDFQISETP